MEDLKSRIATLALTTYNMSLNAFERKCGLPETTLNKMKEGSELRTKNLAKIIRNCPEIDYYYLITGEFKRDNPLYKEFTQADCKEDPEMGEIRPSSGKADTCTAESEKVREMELKLAKMEGERDTYREMVKTLTAELSKRGTINQSASL